MMSQKIVAGILAAAITVSSIAPEAFAEISGVGVGGTSTVNEPTVDTSTDPASGGLDKTEEPGKTVSGDTELPSEPGEGESDYTYNALDDGTIEIKGYSGSAENIVIPAQIDGKSVTRIGNNAFEKSSAKEIVIPDSVTEIGSQAFSGCEKLTSVSIPNSVTMIRDRAFFDCNSLASITIPDSVTDIELQAFCNCTSLKSVTIPASVTDIGDEAFGYYFNDIDELEIKKVDGFKINYVKNTYGHYYATKNGFSDEDCLFTIELNDGTLEISKYAGNSATYEIPGEIDGKKVIRIGNSAFIDCTELTSVTIPDGVTDIRWRAFYNCVSLKSVTIPKSVTYIDNYAFGYYYDSDSFATKKIDGFKINYVKNTYGHMYALKNGFTDEACLLTHELYDGTLEITEYVGNSATYVIPSEIDGKRVTQIGYDAFNDCTELTSITIPDGVTCIGNSAFSYCTSLETVTIPNSVTQIYPRAFYDCTLLKEVTIPASVTSIGNEAFGYYYDRDSSETKKADGFKINYVNNTRGHWYAIKNGFTDGTCFVVNELDDGTAEITGYAGNSATCVIPDEIHGKKVTRIGDSAFIDRTELTSVTIPDGVTYIVDCAFFGCTSLETVTIPNSVINICSSAFRNCTSLKEVTIPASVTYIGDEAFGYYSDIDGSEIKKVDGFKINYVKNTYGHYYAAKNGFSDEDCLLTNELDDGTLEISNYAGNSATYEIPGEINGKKVTRIGDSAFTVCTSLTSVTIPDGVTSIDEAAFWGCTSLTSVTIPDSVTSIKSKAFFNCTSLKSVTIPASVTNINIGDYALGYYEIYNTDSCEWEMYKVDGFKINYVKNTYGHMYALKNGFTDEACLLTHELDDGTLEITKYAGNSATYVIPGEIDGKKVTQIGDKAFKGCAELTSITIPDGVTGIGNNAFSGCTSLETVTIPNSVTYIERNTFYGCTSLETVTIPASVTYIGDSAFYGCTSLKSVTIPESVTYIGAYAFAECYSLKYADIPANVTSIGTSPFCNCRSLENINIDEANKCYTTVDGVLYDKDKTELINYPAGKKDSSYVIPEGIRVIREKTFYGCLNLCELTIPDSVTEIESGAFECSSLISDEYGTIKYVDGWVIGSGHTANVVLKDGTRGIAFEAFSGDGIIEKVTMPDTVKYINGYAFENCTNLSEALLSSSLENIESGAFFNCSNLADIVIPDSVISITSDAFLNTALLDKQNTPVKYVGKWVITAEDRDKIVIKDGTKGIASYAFIGCTSLTDITIPDSVTMIGDYAFGNCNSLTDIKIPNNVKNIGKNVFWFCESLKNVTIPDSVTMIGDMAFVGCKSLTDITIPGSVTMIGDHVFAGCTSLTDITIPGSVTSIGDSAFYNCPKLLDVTIPDSVTNIDDWAFGFDENDEKIDGFKIYCYGGTAGEQYAKDNGFEYEILECKVHKFGEWKTTKPATCTATGTKTRSCSVCGKVETQTIAKTAHKYVNMVVKPTYTAQGYTLHKCSVCGASYKDNETSKLTLAKVTGFKVKSLTSTNVTLQWNKNTSASGYEIEQYKGGKWVNVAKITGNATTSYTVKGLKAGTAGYQFRIRAYRTEGKNKAYSGYSATVKVNTNPYGVGGFKCSSKSSTSVTLKWNKGTTASGYQLHQYKNGKWVTIYTGTKATNTSYTVKGLKAGTAGYRFRIRAYKTYGNTKQYGSWSSEVKVNTNPYGVGGFKCSSKTSTSVTLKWNKGTTASGYQLQQYKNGKWVTIYTGTKATNTSYTVKNLKAGTAGYRFRIRAYKTYGNTKQYGSWSSEVKVNTNPYGVGGFKAKSTAKNSITLGWNKGTTASGYQLQQYKGGKWVTVYTGTKATSTSYTVKSLKANTSYKFRIRAYKTYGNTKQYGSWSGTLTVRTKK